MTDLSNKLDKYVKLSEKQRQKTWRWLAKQSEANQLEVFKLQKKYIFELSKFKNEDKSILYFTALTLAAHEIYNRMHPLKGKNKVADLNNVDDATSNRVNNDRKKRPSEQTDRLFDLKEKVLKLYYVEDLSLRGTKDHLLKYHQFDVSHSTIGTFLKKIG